MSALQIPMIAMTQPRRAPTHGEASRASVKLVTRGELGGLAWVCHLGKINLFGNVGFFGHCMLYTLH